jgi:cysteine desulfurase
MKTAYLDYQASTPLDPRVRAEMLAAFDAPGNASAEEHSFGWAAARLLDESRSAVAATLNAQPGEIVFTSGATEANNIAILGAAAAAPPGRRRILISALEHKSVLEAAYAAEALGFKAEIIPTNSKGIVDVKALSDRVDETVAVVSIMAVNNEIGTLQPVRELAAVAHKAGAFFHVDATQALAAIDVDVELWAIDALSLSGHKIYGPQGIGVLFVADEAPWPLQARTFGGGQERGLRPGTVPVALCVGLGEACRLIKQHGASDRNHAVEIRTRLLSGLRGTFPGLVVTSEEVARHPGCLHVRLPGVGAADLLMRLQPMVAASTGSACTSGVIGTSHVASAIGLAPEEAAECLRFSVGRFSTTEEIDRALNAITSVASRLAR